MNPSVVINSATRSPCERRITLINYRSSCLVSSVESSHPDHHGQDTRNARTYTYTPLCTALDLYYHEMCSQIIASGRHHSESAAQQHLNTTHSSARAYLFLCEYINSSLAYQHPRILERRLSTLFALEEHKSETLQPVSIQIRSTH